MPIYGDGLICADMICWNIVLRKLRCFFAGTNDPSSVSILEALGISRAL